MQGTFGSHPVGVHLMTPLLSFKGVTKFSRQLKKRILLCIVPSSRNPFLITGISQDVPCNKNVAVKRLLYIDRK